MGESDPVNQGSFRTGESVPSSELESMFGVPQEEILAFRDVMRVYSGQEVIIREDDEEKAIYILRAGSVKVFQRSGASQKFMTTMHATNVFGELSVVTDAPRTATVIALSDNVLVYRLANPNLQSVVSNPQWAEILITRLCESLVRSFERQTALNEAVRGLNLKLGSQGTGESP